MVPGLQCDRMAAGTKKQLRERVVDNNLRKTCRSENREPSRCFELQGLAAREKHEREKECRSFAFKGQMFLGDEGARGQIVETRSVEGSDKGYNGRRQWRIQCDTLGRLDWVGLMVVQGWVERDDTPAGALSVRLDKYTNKVVGLDLDRWRETSFRDVFFLLVMGSNIANTTAKQSMSIARTRLTKSIANGWTERQTGVICDRSPRVLAKGADFSLCVVA